MFIMCGYNTNVQVSGAMSLDGPVERSEWYSWQRASGSRWNSYGWRCWQPGRRWSKWRRRHAGRVWPALWRIVLHGIYISPWRRGVLVVATFRIDGAKPGAAPC